LLTARHLLERVEYPEVAFRFAHQQFQEYYAACCMHSLLLGLRSDGPLREFVANYVNRPAWAESLSMVAEMLATDARDGAKHRSLTQAGIS